MLSKTKIQKFPLIPSAFRQLKIRRQDSQMNQDVYCCNTTAVYKKGPLCEKILGGDVF
jgi:hypothetical protein